MIGVKAYRRLQRLGDNCEGWEMTAQAGRWLVDKTAIYQPSTHYPTTCYTPAGRYGRFFCYKTKKGGDKASLNVVLGGFEPPQFFLYQDCSNKKETLKEPP